MGHGTGGWAWYILTTLTAFGAAYALKLQEKNPSLTPLSEEACRMKALSHPNFVRVYDSHDMTVTLNAEAMVIELCEGDCIDLLRKIWDRVWRGPLSPGSRPRPPATGQRWQTLAGGGGHTVL